MQILLLGPLEVTSNGNVMALGPPKERALLALLALNAGSAMSAEQLIDGLWGEEPPATAGKLVQLYVSHLRKAMASCGEDGAIVTHGRGYELQVAREQVDVGRFERLLAQGAARDALALWRGPPLADIATEPFAIAEVRRLEELRTVAQELAIDQDLQAGRHREVLAELEGLLAQEPLRERLHGQRMLALYRAGRQADALEAYREARATLVEEVGIEPGPELRRLQEAILRQDPSLLAAQDERSLVAAEPPLIGREVELERLRDLWRRARDGAAAVALLTGPSGIGRTRLALAFAEEVRQEGAEVVLAGEDPEADARAHAAERPTLLVVDDAAGALKRPAERTPLLVIACADAPDEFPADARLELRPLTRDEAVALVTHEIGDGEFDHDRLIAETGGMPAAVRGWAAQHARARALQRLGDAAGRASAERAGWRVAEDDVAAGVVELQALRERAALAGPPEPSAESPFKGLASFDVDDAGVFFGRERLVAELVARVPGSRLMGIVGPSGSGKSSALRAGLLAALAEGVLPGSEDWQRVVVRPGRHPARELERGLERLPQRGTGVVAVDQFEETFTACQDEAERTALVDAILRCARDTERSTLVVLAIRADFYGHCAAYPELSRALGTNHVLVGPMHREELRRAIELPARRAGLPVEPGLADALVADVEGEPGGLPLLSTMLLELWEQRNGAGLTLDAYERSGGVQEAVARLAEGAYERLDPAGRDQTRRIMLRLSGDGDVRARVPIGELEETRGVLEALAAERLITLGDGEAEIAHEALLREWPRLRGWLEEDAEGRRLHRHLTHSARAWGEADRAADELYRGSRLAAALEWAQSHGEELITTERKFLDASQVEAELAADRQRRANRRLRGLLVGAAVLLVAAVVAGVVALSEREDARDAALTADAQRLGAGALSNERLDQALLLARAGVRLDASRATHSSLLSVLQRQPAALGELRGDGWPLYSVAASADGSLVAIGDERGVASVYDLRTRHRLSHPRSPEGLVQHLAFAPDGSVLAAVVHGDDGKTRVDLVQPRTGRRVRRIDLPPFPEETFYVRALVAFEADGRHLVVEQSDVEFDDGPASVLRRVNARTGAVLRSRRIGRRGAWNLVGTADRRRLFVTSAGDDRTYEIEPSTLRVRRSWPVGARAGAVNTEGSVFALGSADGNVRLLDLRTGRVRALDGAHEAGAEMQMAFTRDGRTLVTTDRREEANAGSKVIVWDVASGSIRERLSGHTGSVGPAISPDGRTLYTAGTDAKMVMWDLTGVRRLDRRFSAGPPMELDDQSPKGLARSPDGETLVVTQGEGRVDLIDARTLALRRSAKLLDGAVLAADFSADGRMLAVTGEGSRVLLRDARTLAAVRELRGPGRGFAQSVVFSPDGRRVAAAILPSERPILVSERSGRVQFWDTRTGDPIGRPLDLGSPDLAFSPDGRLLAAAVLEDDSQVRAVDDGRLVARLRTGDDIRSVAFSPDGRQLALGLYGGEVRLLSTRSWKQVGRGLEGHRTRVTALEYSKDGRRLLTGGTDGSLRLWDARSRQPIGSVLTVEPDAYVAATFSDDGSRIFAIPHVGRGVSWDVRPAAWERHACFVAGRDLTRREWNDALPDRSFQSVCAQR